MKNIVLTIVFALTLGQIALAQSSGDRKPSSPTDRGNRSGIGAKSGPKGSTQGQNEESGNTRKSLRGSGGRRVDSQEGQLGGQDGRPEAGRPGNNGGGNRNNS